MRISINNSRDFLALIIRRKWWVIGPFLALTGALSLLVNFLPEVYVSESSILIRPRDVPTDMVRDLLSGTNTQRLKAIEQRVLSRRNLQRILNDEHADQLPGFSRLNLDQQVLKLREQIAIDFQSQRQVDGTITYLKISYRDRRPDLAQKIAVKLTNLFFDQDRQDREDYVSGATQFLAKEVDKLKLKLEASEGKLSQVKSRNLHQLPGQIESNLRTLERLAADKKANAEAIDRVTTSRLNLEQLMAETPDLIPKTPSPIKSVPPPTPVAQVKPPQTQIKPPDQEALLAGALADAQMRTRMDEYLKAQAEYEAALINHTPDHPDVKTAAIRVDRAKRQIPDNILNPPKVAEKDSSVTPAVAQDSTTSPPVALPVPSLIEAPIEMAANPIYRNQARQLQELRTEQTIRERDKIAIEQEIKKFSERVDQTPAVEQEIGSMLRENEDLKRQFDDLSGKLSQAKLAESLETSRGSQFVALDIPNYPLSPQKPDKSMVTLGAGAFSLLLAIAIAITVDVGRQRVWAASEIEALWGVPVLVDIPEIIVDSDVPVAQKKWQWQMGSVMAAAAVYSACLYGIYMKHDFILRQLDPLLQKIVYR